MGEITMKLTYIARYYSNLKGIIRLNGYCRIKLFKRRHIKFEIIADKKKF